MISLLCVMNALASDPVALRQPVRAGSVSVALAGQTLSAAVRPNVGPSFALVARPHAHVGAAVGAWTPWIGADRPWGVDLFGSGGVDVLWASPGVAVGATGAALAGVRGDRGRWMTGLLMPVAVRLDRPEAVLPTLAESHTSVRVGRLSLGMLAQIGAVFATDGPPAVHLLGGGTVTLAPRGS